MKRLIAALACAMASAGAWAGSFDVSFHDLVFSAERSPGDFGGQDPLWFNVLGGTFTAHIGTSAVVGQPLTYIDTTFDFTGWPFPQSSFSTFAGTASVSWEIGPDYLRATGDSGASGAFDVDISVRVNFEVAQNTRVFVSGVADRTTAAAPNYPQDGDPVGIELFGFAGLGSNVGSILEGAPISLDGTGSLGRSSSVAFGPSRVGTQMSMGVDIFGSPPRFPTPPIPEPSTYALMLAGLAAVGFTARRRRAA